MFVVLLQVYVFPCHISEKLVKWLQRYHYFSIFQDGAWPPSSTSANFNDRRVLEVPGASLCQISSKSLKQFRRYRDFSVLSGSRWPSWIFKLWKSQPLATSIGTKCIMMQTFVTIGQMVTEISRFFFHFPKWRPAAIVDFQISFILTTGKLWRSKTHHRAKFHRNRSSNCGDIVIFHFSRWWPATILDF